MRGYTVKVSVTKDHMIVSELIAQAYSKNWMSRILAKLEANGINKMEKVTELILYKIGLLCDKIRKGILSNEYGNCITTNDSIARPDGNEKLRTEIDDTIKQLQVLNRESKRASVQSKRAKHTSDSLKSLLAIDSIHHYTDEELRESELQCNRDIEEYEEIQRGIKERIGLYDKMLHTIGEEMQRTGIRGECPETGDISSTETNSEANRIEQLTIDTTVEVLE